MKILTLSYHHLSGSYFLDDSPDIGVRRETYRDVEGLAARLQDFDRFTIAVHESFPRTALEPIKKALKNKKVAYK